MRRHPREITPDLLARMRQLWADGYQAKTIGTMLRVSPTTVTKKCKGIEQRKRSQMTAEERSGLMRGWK